VYHENARIINSRYRTVHNNYVYMHKLYIRACFKVDVEVYRYYKFAAKRLPTLLYAAESCPLTPVTNSH